MELSIYDVIRHPVTSEKAYKLNMQHKRLVLEVHPKANKSLIKRAIEKIFEVKVAAVNTHVRKPKLRRVGRHRTMGLTRKQAVITLKSGQSLEIFGQASEKPVGKIGGSE